MTRLIVSWLVAMIGCWHTAFAADDGASYPKQPLTITVNYGAGGGTDAIARALARALEKILGQPVAVENVAGGAGTRGVTAVVRGIPDGYQIGLASNSPMTIAVHSVKGLPWAGPDTYDILAGIGTLYNALCVQPESELKTLADVVNFAKANPGKLKVASIAGGINQYLWDAFSKKANINVRFVPYSGDAEGVASFLGKNTELANLTWSGLKGQIDAGNARPIAIFAPNRLSTSPDVPTFKELGYDVTTTSDYVVFSPNGVPASIRIKISNSVKEALADSDFRKVMAAQNVDVMFTDGETMKARFTDIFKSGATATQTKN